MSSRRLITLNPIILGSTSGLGVLLICAKVKLGERKLKTLKGWKLENIVFCVTTNKKSTAENNNKHQR